MESSFLEDFLKREVDENQVNALVGTLENALGSSRTTVAPTGNSINVSAGKLTSVGQIVSQSVSSQSSVPAILKPNTARVNTSSPNNINIKINGSVDHINKHVVSSGVSNISRSNVSTPPMSRTPASRLTLSPGLSATASNGTSPRVFIAPKSTVPIAPRLGGANIVITPRQAQLLMAQQRFTNPLLQSNLIARMPGVIPRLPGPGGVIAVPPVMNTQIPGLGAIPRGVIHRGAIPRGAIPRGAIPRGAIRGAIPRGAIPRGAIPRGAIPRGAIINMAGGKPDQMIMRMNVPLTPASLTQVKGATNAIPGQINYRFRQVNPVSTQPVPVNGISTANTANITMMKESVKRLKEFFQNLINLACGPNQPPEIGKMVKELVHNLMQGRVSEEEFIEKLQKTLKSDPQPNLVHFLKKTLPHLRETIKKQQMHQVAMKTPANTAVPAAAIIANRIRPTMPSVSVPAVNALMGQPHTTPQQVVRKNLTIPEQMLQKQLLQHGRIIVSSGQVTPGMNSLLQASMQRGAAIAPGAKGFPPKQLIGLNQANVPKEKQKSTAYYSSASGADDDINDVTCMAGVNLMEESQKILSTGDFMSYQTRSIKDTPILVMDNLKKLVDRIAKKSGINDTTSDVLTILSHATEQRLRTILERLTACSLHRNDPHKDEVRYESISDVRNQLRVFEEIDEVERKHRESREREILMRVAKSRSRTEDPEQARLKEKAKQMQLEEEEMNRKRAANRTALEAIGGPRKKRKLDEALESLQNAQTPGNNNPTSSSLTTSSNTVSQNIRSRQHRITIKDLNLVLETERDTTKSLALYRSLMR